MLRTFLENVQFFLLCLYGHSCWVMVCLSDLRIQQFLREPSEFWCKSNRKLGWNNNAVCWPFSPGLQMVGLHFCSHSALSCLICLLHALIYLPHNKPFSKETAKWIFSWWLASNNTEGLFTALFCYIDKKKNLHFLTSLKFQHYYFWWESMTNTVEAQKPRLTPALAKKKKNGNVRLLINHLNK